MSATERRLAERVARLEHAAIHVTIAANEENVERLADVLFAKPAIDCVICGAPGDEDHKPDCAVRT